MTAQIPETLIYDGGRHALTENPLFFYFQVCDRKPSFRPPGSALWRGYIGTWEVIGNRLYLVELAGHLVDGTKATLATLFPDYPERVFAHWYTGRLRIPQGKLLNYIHHGYASTYERDLFIDIERGVVTGTHVKINGSAEDDAHEGYPVAGATIFSSPRQTGDPA